MIKPSEILPGEARSPGLHRRLQLAFARAKGEANLDYACEILAQCVVHEPGNPEFVETMLAKLRVKFGGDKRKAHHRLGLSGAHAFHKAVRHQDWKQAVRLGVELLKADPWHVDTLRGMAQVCAALHHEEAELLYLKQALDAAPKDPEVSRHCAESLARMGKLDQAIACWQRVQSLKSGDKQAARRIAELSDERSRLVLLQDGKPRAKVVPQQVPEPVVRQKETPRTEAPPVTLLPWQVLERAIHENPTDAANYLELAKLLAEEERLAEAQRILEKCLSNCGDVAQAREQLSSLRQPSPQRPVASATRMKGRIPWLELGLVAAAIALVLQLAPGLGPALVQKAAEHTQVLVFLANGVAVVLLVLWRARQQWVTQ